MICIEFRLLCLRLDRVLVGDPTRLVWDVLRPVRLGMRLSMGDMGLAPLTPIPRTVDSDWWLGDTASIPAPGSSRLGLRANIDPGLSRLARAVTGGLRAYSVSQLGSSVTLEMRSAWVKPGLVCPVPASWERLYSGLVDA